MPIPHHGAPCSVTELYDTTFLDCLATGNNDINTDDNYNNPVVLKAMREKDLKLIYKAELDYSIDDLCIYLRLSKLLLNEQARQKVAEMIRSYILYRQAVSDTVTNIDKELDALYISLVGDSNIPQTLDQTLRTAYRKSDDIATPNAYDFFKRLSDCYV
jgi:hypothetical protein